MVKKIKKRISVKKPGKATVAPTGGQILKKDPRDCIPHVEIPPHSIIVEEHPDDTITVSTNTHKITKAHRSNLDVILMPYCGMGTKLNIRVGHFEGDNWVENEEYRQQIIQKADRNTDLHVFFNEEHRVVYNMYRNLLWATCNPTRYFDIANLKGIAKNKPVIFCGAGPHLKAEFANIKRIIEEDRAIVIAGGSALRVFAKERVYPHFGLAFDPTPHEQTVVFDFLDEEFLKKVPMIVGLGLYHTCFDQLQNAYVGFSSSVQELGRFFIKDATILSEGRVGVSTMAPYAAKLMGASEIVYLGVGAFYNEGEVPKPYADMSDEEFKKTGRDDLTKQPDYIEAAPGKYSKLSWIRELKDVIANVPALGLKLSTFREDTLFFDLYKDMEYRSFDSLFNIKKVKKLTLKTNPLAITMDEVLEKYDLLLENIEELLPLAHVTQGPTPYRGELRERNKFYRHFLFMYDNVQEFRTFRHIQYNYALIRGVLRFNRLQMKSAIVETHKKLSNLQIEIATSLSTELEVHDVALEIEVDGNLQQHDLPVCTQYKQSIQEAAKHETKLDQ